MEHTKLAIGEDATFTVSAVEEVKTGSWPDYILWAEQGASYIAPKGALDRQFAKIKLTPAQLVGHVVRLERAPNKEDAKKSWWNLHIVGKADLTKAPSKRLAGPASPERPAAGPPAFFDDVPLPESEDGPTINEQIGLADPAFEGASAKEISYYALAERVAAFQAKLAKLYELPFDAASINAMTFSIWKN